MFDLDTLTTLLVAIAPSISAVLTIIGGFVALNKKAKDKISKTEEEAKIKVSQTQRDIALIKSKIASIENYLSNKEN